MKNSRKEQNTNIDEYEDLTLFADESFDTGDVDLFEFSSEDDSPLTRLKSIILSLDWEINDDILEELTDEVAVLQQESQGEKVAGIYLQGLGKIGRYIQHKGAYAHPNAIKLLLTFYYNFEKIISTENIPEEEVTLLLQGDVRKFRILQYQINQEEKPAPPPADNEVPSQAPTSEASGEEENHLRALKASILSLDWEVTKENLRQFNEHLNPLFTQLEDDKPALILAQGLRALGDYISETQAQSHPESFTLLHSFSEGLEQVTAISPEQRNKEQLQNLLSDRISRLNILKGLIAEKASEQPSDGLVDELVEEVTSPAAFSDESPVLAPEIEKIDEVQEPEASFELQEEVEVDLESELDDLFPTISTPAMETSDVQYPDEVLSPDAIQPIEDEISDEFIESEVGSKRGLAPALSESDEFFGFNEDNESLDIPTQSDLTDQLDKLFAEEESTTSTADEQTTHSSNELEPALAGQESLNQALEGFEAPANIIDEPLENEKELDGDIASKLDSFFGEDSEDTNVPLETVAEEPFEDDSMSMAPALTESEGEDQGFSAEESLQELDESPLKDITEKLDFFFDENEDSKLLEDDDLVKSNEHPVDAFDFLATSEPEEETAAIGNQDQDVDIETQPDIVNELDFVFNESDVAEDEGELQLEDNLLSSLVEDSADELFTSEIDQKNIIISELGALLPSTIRMPDDTNISQATELISQLKATEQSTDEKVLTQLLEGVIEQFVHSRFINLSATEKLVNNLYESLHKADGFDISEAVGKYVKWQADVVSKIADAAKNSAIISTAGKSVGSADGPGIDINQLRDVLKDEFTQFKEELKKED